MKKIFLAMLLVFVSTGLFAANENKETKEYILFGKSKHVALRMSSLLPTPLGSGTRTNEDKRQYVLSNIMDIEYQTLALPNSELAECENDIRNSNNYIFNT